MGIEAEKAVFSPIIAPTMVAPAGYSPAVAPAIAPYAAPVATPIAPVVGGGLGLGGDGLVSALVLASVLGGRGFGAYGGVAPVAAEVAPVAGLLAGDVASKVVTLQNAANVLPLVESVKTDVLSAMQGQTIGLNGQFTDALLAELNQTIGFNNQFTTLGTRIGEGEKEAIRSAMASIIAGMNNTQSIKDQAATFQVANSEQFCALRALVLSDGEATRSLINTNTINGLRDELAAERRNRDQREIEINVTQTNLQTQQQVAAQFQAQTGFLATTLNSLADQLNRNTNSLINIGSGSVASSPLTSNLANTKVNS